MCRRPSEGAGQERVNKLQNAVEMRGVTKTFGSVIANDRIDLDIRQGEILSLLGENGSGKTTLMNMLSGIYYPDERSRSPSGARPVTIRSPKDAFDLGIGMIHQHFKLVDVLTASENIVLGLKEKGRLNLREVSARVREICGKYGFSIDPDKKIYDMSVSEKQTVEIVKVLYRGADILILDEPTAVLTPQETDRLFDVLRNMRKDGKSIVIITHKLHEVMAISDRVAVLRKGVFVGEVPTSETDPQKLTDMMVGHGGDPEHQPPPGGTPPPAAGGEGPDRPARRRASGRWTRCPSRPSAVRSWGWQASPAAARRSCWRPSPACRPAQPGSHVIYHPPTPDEAIAGRPCAGGSGTARSCWAKIPGRSTGSACPWPLCRRTGWAWAWWAPWAWRTT